MAATHLAYLDLALDKFSGTDPDQDAESFIQLIERKINFALGDAPAHPDALANYNFRKKALFSSLLRGPAAEWYGSTIEAATPWEDIRTNFITRFSDGRNKFRHRLEVEHCVRRDGEEIRNFLHRIKKTIDKGWPDDTNGIPNAQGDAERTTQKRQQKQKYMDYNLRGLKPNYLQLKAREQLMEYPNATRNDFSTHKNHEDIMLQVCSKFLHDLQLKIDLATEMRNLRVELQEHRVIAKERDPRARALNQKEKQKTVRFCSYCQMKGHTPKWCRKKMRDEEIRKIRYEMTSKNNHVPNQNHGTNAVDRSAQYDQNVEQCLNSDDGHNPTNELPLTTEEETGQDEFNEITPSERRSFSRNSGMRFNAAQFTSDGESDDELPNPLPLG